MMVFSKEELLSIIDEVLLNDVDLKNKICEDMDINLIKEVKASLIRICPCIF